MSDHTTTIFNYIVEQQQQKEEEKSEIKHRTGSDDCSHDLTRVAKTPKKSKMLKKT